VADLVALVQGSTALTADLPESLGKPETLARACSGLALMEWPTSELRYKRQRYDFEVPAIVGC